MNKQTILTIIILTLINSVVSTNVQAQFRIEHGVEMSVAKRENYGTVKKTYEIRDESLSIHNKENIIRLDDMCWRYQLRVKYKRFSLYSDTYIYMHPRSLLSYAPTLGVFDIDIRYKYKKIKIKCGHRCVHSIENYDQPRPSTFGGYTLKMSVSYNIK